MSQIAIIVILEGDRTQDSPDGLAERVKEACESDGLPVKACHPYKPEEPLVGTTALMSTQISAPPRPGTTQS